jgi:hypothetical protein
MRGPDRAAEGPPGHRVAREAIGVAARSMSQQSQIRLTPGHDARAVEAIGSVAA